MRVRFCWGSRNNIKRLIFELRVKVDYIVMAHRFGLRLEFKKKNLGPSPPTIVWGLLRY